MTYEKRRDRPKLSTNSLPCNLCGLEETRIIQNAEDPFCVVQCKCCGLAYTDPMPSGHFLADHYDEAYYADWVHKQAPGRDRMWKKRLRELATYGKGGRLLDVGCGLTTFLQAARAEGYEVQGTEVSEYIASVGSDEANVHVFRGELEEARFPRDHFDIVTMWHSLEHMTDPRGSLDEAFRILKENGLLVVAVPNLHNAVLRFFYRLVKGKSLALFSTEAKELHLYHFSETTLTGMLQKAGFEIIAVKPDLSAVVLGRRLMDAVSAAICGITGKNYSDGIKVFARKKTAETVEPGTP